MRSGHPHAVVNIFVKIKILHTKRVDITQITTQIAASRDDHYRSVTLESPFDPNGHVNVNMDLISLIVVASHCQVVSLTQPGSIMIKPKGYRIYSLEMYHDKYKDMDLDSLK